MLRSGVKCAVTTLVLCSSVAGAFSPQSGARPFITMPFGSLASTVQAEDVELTVSDDFGSTPAKEKLTESLYRAQVAMSPGFFSADATLTAFFETYVNAVSVAPSTIPGAGKGLFAERDLQCGTLVSLYPVHATGINFFDDGSSFWITADDMDEEYFFRDSEEGSDDGNYLLYLLGNRPLEQGLNGAPFVDANPNRSPRPGWLAHYINDGAIIKANSEKGVLDYLKSSSLLTNCVICPFGPSPLLAAVVTRDVRKGEELFTSYGSSYWLDDMCATVEDWPNKTEKIVDLEKQMAETLFLSMDRASVAYQEEVMALEDAFLSASGSQE